MLKVELTAAVPLHEYRVETESGRLFCWSASSMEDLFRQLVEHGHRATHVQLMSEYEAEQHRIEGQQELNHEHEIVEKGSAVA